MPEQSNTDIVRGIYAAFLRNDLPAVLDSLTDDVEWTWYGPAEIPFAGTRHGRDAVAEWFAIIADTVEFHQFEPAGFEFVAEGDTVAVQGFERISAKPAGRPIDHHWVQFMTLRGGKVARFRQFPDTAAVVEAFLPAGNAAHMRRIIEEGWNSKNPAAFDGAFADDFVSHTPSGEFAGPDGYKQLYNAYVTAFPDCQFTIDTLVAEGDTVSLSYTFSGTHTGPLQDVPATGKRVSVQGVSVSRVVGGRSIEERVLWDNHGLMQQLGLAE